MPGKEQVSLRPQGIQETVLPSSKRCTGSTRSLPSFWIIFTRRILPSFSSGMSCVGSTCSQSARRVSSRARASDGLQCRCQARS